MPQVHTQVANNELAVFLNTGAITKIRKLPYPDPKPIYDAIKKRLAALEKTAIYLGEIRTVSDEIKQSLESLSAVLKTQLKEIDERIEQLNSFPDDIPWKQKLHDKLEHLAIRIEDVIETCDLATNEEFVKMIKAQVAYLMNESTKN